MNYNASYLTDSQGRRRSVVPSLADWKKVQKQLQLAEVKEQLHDAFTEIREMEAGRQPVVTLQDFLQEWDDEQQAANGE